MDKFRELSASLKANADELRRDGVYGCCAGTYRHAAAQIDAILREEAQGDVGAVDAKAWLLDVMGTWDFTMPTGAFDKIVNRIAASATLRAEPCFDEREIDTCTGVEQLRRWAHCMRRERDQWRNSALLLEAERSEVSVPLHRDITRDPERIASHMEFMEAGIVQIVGDSAAISQVVKLLRASGSGYATPRTEPAEGRGAVAQVAKCAGIGDRSIFLWTYPGGLHGFLGDHPVGTKLYTTPPAGDGKPVAFRAINRNGSKGAWHDTSEDAETLRKWISTGWQIEYAYAAPPAGDGAARKTGTCPQCHAYPYRDGQCGASDCPQDAGDAARVTDWIVGDGLGGIKAEAHFLTTHDDDRVKRAGTRLLERADKIITALAAREPDDGARVTDEDARAVQRLVDRIDLDFVPGTYGDLGAAIEAAEPALRRIAALVAREGGAK